jgi:hypothetical protein
MLVARFSLTPRPVSDAKFIFCFVRQTGRCRRSKTSLVSAGAALTITFALCATTVYADLIRQPDPLMHNWRVQEHRTNVPDFFDGLAFVSAAVGLIASTLFLINWLLS